ncbi:MAG: sensor histidine kinase [Sulfuriferula sp.]
MTIRKTLVVAFLLVSLVPAIALTYLAFVKTQEAMQAEIEQTLLVQAATVSADTDKMLFERFQNAITWSHLEVMQDIYVKDIDKRLSAFLSELKTGYQNVYHDLYCIDTSGMIVASNNAAAIGTALTSQRAWLHATLPGGRVVLDIPDGSTMNIRSLIPSKFGSGNLGELVLSFDWTQIFQILDQAARDGRMVAILDHDGKVIAASAELRRQGFLMSKKFQPWLSKIPKSGVEIVDGSPLHTSRAIIGFDRSHGYENFSGLDWTTIVIQPLDQALLPIHRLAIVFLGFLLATIVIATWVSLWVANNIARPILALTAFTRRFVDEKSLPPSPPVSSGEVGELTSAFIQMVQDLDQSRQHLIRASRFAVMGEMAAVMAHEIRTPLGILRSSSQMLKREPQISDEARELIGFIESETDRLNRLVSTMLDGTRARLPSFQLINLHTQIHNCLQMLAAQTQKKNIQVAELLKSADPYCECDAEQMTQVFLNLFMNALQVLPEHGKITVTSRNEFEKIIIEIADNGPGIAKAERAKIFDSFFHKREGGIGLGLAVVQQIVSAHGGDITVGESRWGGALFRIAIPRKMSAKT